MPPEDVTQGLGSQWRRARAPLSELCPRERTVTEGRPLPTLAAVQGRRQRETPPPPLPPPRRVSNKQAWAVPAAGAGRPGQVAARLCSWVPCMAGEGWPSHFCSSHAGWWSWHSRPEAGSSSVARPLGHLGLFPPSSRPAPQDQHLETQRKGGPLPLSSGPWAC